jgi:hypothetical protein
MSKGLGEAAVGSSLERYLSIDIPKLIYLGSTEEVKLSVKSQKSVSAQKITLNIGSQKKEVPCSY